MEVFTHLVCSDIKKPASSIIRASGKSLPIREELQVFLKMHDGIHITHHTN